MMLSVGGWATDSKLFSKLVSTEENMQKFAMEAINYLRKHDFDGLDIDWQYPGTRGSPSKDVERYYRLLRVSLFGCCCSVLPRPFQPCTESCS